MTKSKRSTTTPSPQILTIKPGQLPHNVRTLHHGAIVTIYDKRGMGRTATVEGKPWCDRHGEDTSVVHTGKKTIPIVIPRRCTCPPSVPPNRIALILKGGRKLDLHIIG